MRIDWLRRRQTRDEFICTQNDDIVRTAPTMPASGAEDEVERAGEREWNEMPNERAKVSLS